jgi:hypothetical protein
MMGSMNHVVRSGQSASDFVERADCLEGAYLKLPFALIATQRFDHGKVSEYRATLPDGGLALLRVVGGKGWELVIRVASANTETPLGLFATPFDAVMALVAENASKGR